MREGRICQKWDTSRHATPREAWGGEATDFTPKLAQPDLLAYLGRACGLGELTLREVEHSTAGNRSLDILAERPDGSPVAIENQYGTADHDHLTRALAYAVAIPAPVLLLVAEDHRDEFIAVADYLNRIAGTDEDAIRIWLVKVRAVKRVGDTIWSPEFVIMAEPNEWEARHRVKSPVLASLDEFYSKASEGAAEAFASEARELVEHWLDTPGGEEAHSSAGVVSLYVPSSTGEGRTCAVQLGITGSVTVCRGYLRDGCPAFQSDDGLALLDARILQHFPEARWTGKRYFIQVPSLDLAQARAFGDWLLDVTSPVGTDPIT